MNRILPALLAATAACVCVAARADDTTAPPAHPMSRHEADKQADAQYKADVKDAEAKHALAKANCPSSWTAKGRSCKDDVGAEERKEKADARLKQVETKDADH